MISAEVAAYLIPAHPFSRAAMAPPLPIGTVPAPLEVGCPPRGSGAPPGLEVVSTSMKSKLSCSWMLSVGGDGAVGGFLPWSERPLREVSLASCGPRGWVEFVFRIRLRILRISYKGDFGRRNAYF